MNLEEATGQFCTGTKFYGLVNSYVLFQLRQKGEMGGIKSLKQLTDSDEIWLVIDQTTIIIFTILDLLDWTGFTLVKVNANIPIIGEL